MSYGSETTDGIAAGNNGIVDQNPYFSPDAYSIIYRGSTNAPTDDSAAATQNSSENEASPRELRVQADTDTEITAYSERSEWSLINMLLVLLGIAFLVPLLFSKRDRRETKHHIFLLSGVALLVISIVVFFTMHNLSSPMVFVDVWTILHGALFAGEIVLLLLSFESRQQKIQRRVTGFLSI